ncbi:insulinoma-associated protein 1-like [Lepisosteus oculatus]|uniref:insulinoma-associated protein 1-like n=1 Tax=Lepisosteus oculatus TaxID=7918 RepID=UPI0035F507D3
MPRGFLVKRTAKAGPVSYRVRQGPGRDGPPASGLCCVPAPAPAMPRCLESSDSAAAAAVLPLLGASRFQSVENRLRRGGMPEALCAPSLSPDRPVSAAPQQRHPAAADPLDRKRNSSSPVQAESFPEPPPSPYTTLGGTPVAFPSSLADMTSKLGSAALSGDLKRPAGPQPPPPPPPPKRPRTGGRDAVTTSPVLGLRITEGPGDGAPPRGRARSPLGEFVCQLCRERYADPLSLAQHGCSRIVRVEYRCADCDKAFSCPANLASHRRWHKPRGAPAEGGALPAAGQPEERHPSPPPPPPRSQSRPDLSPPPPPPEAGPEEELLFDCPQCGKKFRRQAYLRKHLALHARQAAGFPDKRAGPSPGTGNGESPAPAAGELHPCRFCAETFFSCPGLTRHLHACHPTHHTARAAV